MELIQCLMIILYCVIHRRMRAHSSPARSLCLLLFFLILVYPPRPQFFNALALHESWRQRCRRVRVHWALIIQN
jgi:hypothetical protein